MPISALIGRWGLRSAANYNSIQHYCKHDSTAVQLYGCTLGSVGTPVLTGLPPVNGFWPVNGPTPRQLACQRACNGPTSPSSTVSGIHMGTEDSKGAEACECANMGTRLVI